MGDLTDFSFFLEGPQRGPGADQPPAARRGRRTLLEHGQLHNRRDQLVQIFEGAWGEIGWELQRYKKPEDLIRIFSPLSNSFAQEIISVFCRPSTEAPSPNRLRKVRAELRSLIKPLYDTEKARREAQENLQRVEWAFGQATKQTRRLVKRQRKKRRKEFAKAALAYRNVYQRERHLEMQVRCLEASFARLELSRFLKSKRYTLTPLSLANAAAGLPYMGWRQSMRRNAKSRSIIANGLTYQIFKSIRYLAATASKKMENALVADFRAGIRLLPSRYQLPRAELAEKWLYLERAIRHAYRTKPHPKVLPFEITKRYLKEIQSQSQVDMVLAEQAKLKLLKRF